MFPSTMAWLGSTERPIVNPSKTREQETAFQAGSIHRTDDSDKKDSLNAVL
jgi:hypothetical protein